MEAFDDEGEAIDQGLQYRDEVAFADALDRGNPLELRDLVNRIDMVDPFGAVPVTLMNGVDTDIARTTFGPGFASFTNAALYRMRFVDRPSLPSIGCRLPQVVEVRDRDAGKPLVLCLLENLPGTLTELLGGRTTERAV